MIKESMNQLLLLVAGIAVLLFISSCEILISEEDKDGKAFIAYSWVVGPISFYTEDPAFEDDSYIQNGVYRETSPADYYFEYTAWDDSYWYGTYTIYINEGTEGRLFGGGVDGEDIYFELSCLSLGPTLYTWPEEYASGSPESKNLHNERYQEELDLERRMAPNLLVKPRREYSEQHNRYILYRNSQPEYTEQQIVTADKYTVVLRFGGGWEYSFQY